MREVLKWNEDNITGKRSELKCYKPDNGLIGKATIQLFNENGEVVNETYTENIIKHGLDEAIFYNNVFRSLYGHTDSSSVNMGEYISSIPAPFSRIYLTKNDAEENVDNLIAKGKVIGWSPRLDQNAGSDKTRGIYNPSESYSKITDNNYAHYHLVYDFGTSQANGTFDTVYWSRYVHKATGYVPAFNVVQVNPIAPKVRLDGRVKNTVDNKYVIEKDSKWYEISNIDAHAQRIQAVKTGDTPVKAKFINDWSKGGKNRVDLSYTGSYGNRIYSLKTYNEFDELVDTLVVDKSIIPEFGEKVSSSSNTGFNVYLESLICDNGDVLLRIYYQSASYAFPNHDTNTGADLGGTSKSITIFAVYNILSKNWTIPPNKPNVDNYKDMYNKSMMARPTATKASSFIIDGLEFYVAQSSNALLYTVERESLLNYNVVYFGTDCYYTGTHSTAISRWFYRKANVLMCVGDNDSGGMHMFKVLPLIAHTKLPAPVTKTSADTMKVQYDYYIQIPNIFPVDGDFINPPLEQATKEE